MCAACQAGSSLLSVLVGTCALQDMARVARWMAGKAVGLVLSGGGSRGLAHLGVLHALDDAGVPIDVIGGTSQVDGPLSPYSHTLSEPACSGCLPATEAAPWRLSLAILCCPCAFGAMPHLLPPVVHPLAVEHR